MTQVPGLGAVRTPWATRPGASCRSDAVTSGAPAAAPDQASLSSLPLHDATREAEAAQEGQAPSALRKAGAFLIGAVSLLGVVGTAVPTMAAETIGAATTISIPAESGASTSTSTPGLVTRAAGGGSTASEARSAGGASSASEARPAGDGSTASEARPAGGGSSSAIEARPAGDGSTASEARSSGEGRSNTAPWQDPQAGFAADSTGRPAEKDPRAVRTEDFLRDWTDGLFDQRIPMGDRLDQAMLRRVPGAQAFPSVMGNAQGAPPLGSLQGINSLEQLRARVDGFYGSQAPSFNQVALDMGARYGSQNYAYGAGGSIPSDRSAFALFNDQKGVCVEIHSAITAYRAAHGQEAYLVGSSATGNAHAFTVFKDNGRWYVQNYGKVIQTDARNLRDLFDRALPEEVRPQLLRPQADGTMQVVGRGFVTGSGMADRRFSERAGSGSFDPFIEQGPFAGFRDGSLTYSTGSSYLTVNPFSGEVAAGHNYQVENDGTRETVTGFAGRLASDGGRVDGKWESESRWLTGNHWGRSRVAVFGGAELDGASPQYWENEPVRRTMHVGASYQRNESWLHGQGDLKLETGYDAHVRGVWTYGLDAPTRNAATQSLNGGAPVYLGDYTRMLGDAQASAGATVGGFYSPSPDLVVRAGVRVGENAASFNSLNAGTALRNGFEPSAYAEGTWKSGHGVMAGGALQVPLNGGGDYRLASVVGYSPSQRLTVACSYTRERFVGETTDRVRVGVGVSPHKNVEVTVGAETEGIARDNAPRQLTAVGGVKVRF